MKPEPIELCADALTELGAQQPATDDADHRPTGRTQRVAHHRQDGRASQRPGGGSFQCAKPVRRNARRTPNGAADL